MRHLVRQVAFTLHILETFTQVKLFQLSLAERLPLGTLTFAKSIWDGKFWFSFVMSRWMKMLTSWGMHPQDLSGLGS